MERNWKTAEAEFKRARIDMDAKVKLGEANKRDYSKLVRTQVDRILEEAQHPEDVVVYFMTQMDIAQKIIRETPHLQDAEEAKIRINKIRSRAVAAIDKINSSFSHNAMEKLEKINMASEDERLAIVDKRVASRLVRRIVDDDSFPIYQSNVHCAYVAYKSGNVGGSKAFLEAFDSMITSYFKHNGPVTRHTIFKIPEASELHTPGWWDGTVVDDIEYVDVERLLDVVLPVSKAIKKTPTIDAIRMMR